MHALAVGLRSFLRFLEFTGRVRPGWAAAVPCPASLAFPPPAQVLDPALRLRFLRSFDRHTAAGRRDYAIALCFSELALRANEVAALTLDDLNWCALTVRLRQTKQRRERLLPLPSRVAHALVVYLQRRRPQRRGKLASCPHHLAHHAEQRRHPQEQHPEADSPTVTTRAISIGRAFFKTVAADVRRVGATAAGCCIGPRNGARLWSKTQPQHFCHRDGWSGGHSRAPFLGRLRFQSAICNHAIRVSLLTSTATVLKRPT
ncbi:MAG: tyrosine-type recombinase/integrase [Verrucomicrobia bacterium]|nr:tyrosine-type recombinase/integrase [Verrucomicrobiota bacterium]